MQFMPVVCPLTVWNPPDCPLNADWSLWLPVHMSSLV